MTKPETYRALPVDVEAIELTQYGDFVRAVQWILDNGGTAYFSPNDQADCLLLVTNGGTLLDAYAGSYVVRDADGNFSLWAAEAFVNAHVKVEPTAEPDETTPLGFTGTGAPSRKGGAHLVGGATLPLPNG